MIKELCYISGSQVRLFCFICACVFIAFEAHAGNAETLSELQLMNARESLMLWESTEVQASAELRKAIANSIVRKVMLVRSASPNIRKLRAEALETLCLLSEEPNIGDAIEDSQLAALANDYLKSAKPEVMANLRKLQKTMKGTGCFASPKSNLG